MGIISYVNGILFYIVINYYFRRYEKRKGYRPSGTHIIMKSRLRRNEVFNTANALLQKDPGRNICVIRNDSENRKKVMCWEALDGTSMSFQRSRGALLYYCQDQFIYKDYIPK